MAGLLRFYGLLLHVVECFDQFFPAKENPALNGADTQVEVFGNFFVFKPFVMHFEGDAVFIFKIINHFRNFLV